MTTTEPTVSRADLALAEELLDRLAAHDLAAIPLLFEPDADLRALQPDGLLVGKGTHDIVEMFTMWFGDVDQFEVVGRSSGRIGARLALRWRVRLRAERFGKHPRVIEQCAYAATSPSNRIRTLSLVCSGYGLAGTDG